VNVHVALTVGNIDKSLSFYRRLFGIEPTRVQPGYAKFDVQDPSVNLTLNEGVPTGQGALSHLGIQVKSTEDVLSIRRQWQQAGLETRDEMNTDCCYALQDKAWVRDPDGNEWEVFAVLEDTDTSGPTCCSPRTALVSIE